MSVLGKYKRVIWIVLDGVGAGEAHDAAAFGDIGSNTLGNLSKKIAATRSTPLHIPNLVKLGAGKITSLANDSGIQESEIIGAYGKASELSTGKDTTSGHWEMTGLVVKEPFEVYANGFSPEIVDRWIQENNLPGVLCNEAASGTEVLEKLGKEHMLTGKPILYTSIHQ